MALSHAYHNLKERFEGPAEVLQYHGFDEDDLNSTLTELVEDNGFDLGASVGSAFLLGYTAGRDPSLGSEPENAGAAPLPEGAQLPEVEDEEGEQRDDEVNDTVPYEEPAVPEADESDNEGAHPTRDVPRTDEPVGQPVEEDVTDDDSDERAEDGATEPDESKD